MNTNRIPFNNPTYKARVTLEIKRTIKGAGYAPTRITNQGKQYFAYLPTDDQLTQSTLESRFQDTTLQPVAFGRERGIGHWLALEKRS